MISCKGIMLERKERLLYVLSDMECFQKQEFKRYIHESHGSQNPDFYAGADAAFEFSWNGIERIVKEIILKRLEESIQEEGEK